MRKDKDHKNNSPLTGTASSGQSALNRAYDLQKRVATVGFDWSGPESVLHKLREELDELAVEIPTSQYEAAREELGDLLFVCVAMARHLDADPETVLQAANRKFEHRFHGMEQLLKEQGITLNKATPDEMEACWQLFKKQDRDK